MTEVISYAFSSKTLNTSNDTSKYSPNISLLTSLLKFYSDPEHIKQLYMLISTEDKISLRLLEWTVIDYAKNDTLVINNGITNRFFVHVNYKATLSGYSKKQFDPCCRTQRIDIPYENKLLKTTVGQMKFIRWAIENKIIEYIRNNFTMLFKEMGNRSQTSKKSLKAVSKNADGTVKPDIKTRKRRNDALSHTLKNFSVDNCPTTIKFSI